MLRDVIVSNESLWVIAEALDAIFDVFADSPVADVASGNIELLAHLQKTVPVLKSRVSTVDILYIESLKLCCVVLRCVLV